MEGKRAGEMLSNVVGAELESLLIRRLQPLLAPVLLFNQLLDNRSIDVEQFDQHARGGDILHQHTLARLTKTLIAHLGQRHADVSDIVANEFSVERPGGIVEDVTAG